MRRAGIGFLALAAVAAFVVPGRAQSPAPAPSLTPAPAATPTRAPLVRFTGQLLDVRNGYVYFTTGDAFKLIDAPRIADYDNGQPTTLRPAPKMFARAVLDPATHDVVELDITKRRLPADTAYADAHQYVAVKSTTQPAPEIVGQRITGKQVPVVFLVQVPPNTPLNADVYISTDASGWNPQAIKLDRIDGQHYRTSFRFASGTKFAFRVTRGTWQQEEVGENGLEPAPHDFFVREIDAQVARVTVYAWSDERADQAAPQPGAIPTPFNPNPFPNGGDFPPSRATPPGGFPTPRVPVNPNQPH